MVRDPDRQAEKELVRARSPIAELVRDLAGAEFKSRGGEDLWACCPFHAEDTASFHVRPRLGLYKCFGCGASGDVFSFVQESRGVDFREALRFLAERAGITLGSLLPEERRAVSEARRLRETLEAAARLFSQAMGAEGRSALHYMRERKFTPETLKTFDVGFVPADFRRGLTQAGVSAQDLDAAGFTGAFAGRVSFGIRDSHGGLVGFGARMLGRGDGPKYVNTRETSAFNKRRLLYGLDKAARTAAKSRRLVLMEGYTDVMMAHQQGTQDAVATMGTSFTAEHMDALPARVDNLVLLFDGDRAGADAAERTVRMLLDRGIECRVLMLPDGQDPCDWFSDHGGDAFSEELTRSARSSVSFLSSRELAQRDPGQPGAREAAARAVIEACRTLRDPMRREGIAAEVAAACGVDRNLLRRSAGRSDPSRHPVGASLPATYEDKVQYAALAALAEGGAAGAELTVLVQQGALTQAGARRLFELALPGAAGSADVTGWMERAQEADPVLAGFLDAVLHPAPQAPVPPVAEALSHLRAGLVRRQEREARVVVLSRPDLDSDPDAIRALAASIATARKQRLSSGSGTSKNVSRTINPNEPDPNAESESW